MRPIRALSILILAFAVSFAADAVGEVGRNGGIVVLPSAVPFSEPGEEIRGTYMFQASRPISARLPENLRDVVFATSVGAGMPLTMGRIHGEDFIVSQQDLQQFRAAGVSSFDVRLVGADGMCLHMRVMLKSDETSALLVW